MIFEILGHLRLRRDGLEMPLGAAKERTLLGILLLEHDQVIGLERLVDEVWPHKPPAQPVSSLRVLISRVRRTLSAVGCEERLRTVPPGYILTVGEGELDAARFSALARQGSELIGSGQPDLATKVLSDALGLWRGDVLSDLKLGGPSTASVRQLQEDRLVVIEQRIEADLSRGCHEDVLDELEGLTHDHPLRENLWHKLVLALARAGRYSDAMERIERHQALAAEIGLVPSSTFAELAVAVRERSPDLGWGPDRGGRAALIGLPTPLPRPILEARATLIGRGAEMDRILTIFGDVVAGESMTALISGEPGVGKTSVAVEAASVIHDRGATVLYGQCDEDLHIAYQPFRQALQEHLTGLDRAAVEALFGRWPPLARLAGSWSDRTERWSASASSADAEGERLMLFESVEGWLHELADARPVLLVIDDLHWASGPTVSLLRHLAHHQPCRLMCIATFRDTDASETSTLREMLAGVHRQSNVHRLTLAGLDRNGVAQLLEARTGGALEEDELQLAARIHDETGGNPFFATQLVRHVLETGDAETGRLTAHTQFQLPDGVRDVIRRRVERLSPATQQILRVAAVIGPVAPFALLSSMPQSGEIEGLLDALDESINARLLVESTDADYVFAHALVRKTIYSSLSAARRRELHRAIAEALVVLPGAVPDRNVALAHHFCLGARIGDGPRAASYAVSAGRDALAQVAHEMALQQFRRGLEVLQRFGPPDHLLEADLYLGMAEACNRTSDHHGRSRAAWQAADAARRAGSDDRLAQAAYWAARFGVVGSLDKQVVNLCEEALERLGPGPSIWKARVTGVLASVRALAGEGVGVDFLAQDAVATARATGDPLALVEALDARFTTLSGSPEVAQRLVVAEEMVAVSKRAHDLSALGDGHRFRAAARLISGDREGFDSDFAAMTSIGERMRDGFLRAIAAQWRATVALLDGHFAEVEAAAGEAVELSGQDVNFVNAWAAQLLWLRHEQGRLGEFLPLLEATVQDNPGIVGFRAALAMAYATLGRPDDATVILHDILDGLSPIPRDWIRTASLTLCAEAAAILRDRSAAVRLEQELSPYAGQLVLVATGTHCPGAIDRFRGMLAAVDHDYNRALALLNSALLVEERCRTAPNAARTRLWYARTLAKSEDHLGMAAELASEAVATAERLGMRGVAADAAALVTELPNPTGIQ